MSIKQTLLMTIVLILTLVVLEGAMLLRLRGQVANYRNYWAKRAEEKVVYNSLWYIALGDSAAQGIGASKPQNGYVGLVANALNQKSGRPIHVVNLSVNGAKLADVLDSQLTSLKKINIPQDAIITLDIGANDMANFQAKQFSDDLDTILGVMPSITVVSDVPYFGGGLHRDREVNVLAANKIFEQLTTKYKLRLAPLHKVTMEAGSWPLDSAADLFHPNNRGYKNWYAAFWQVLGKT